MGKRLSEAAFASSGVLVVVAGIALIGAQVAPIDRPGVDLPDVAPLTVAAEPEAPEAAEEPVGSSVDLDAPGSEPPPAAEGAEEIVAVPPAPAEEIVVVPPAPAENVEPTGRPDSPGKSEEHKPKDRGPKK